MDDEITWKVEYVPFLPSGDAKRRSLSAVRAIEILRAGDAPCDAETVAMLCNMVERAAFFLRGGAQDLLAAPERRREADAFLKLLASEPHLALDQKPPHDISSMMRWCVKRDAVDLETRAGVKWAALWARKMIRVRRPKRSRPGESIPFDSCVMHILSAIELCAASTKFGRSDEADHYRHPNDPDDFRPERPTGLAFALLVRDAIVDAASSGADAAAVVLLERVREKPARSLVNALKEFRGE